MGKTMYEIWMQLSRQRTLEAGLCVALAAIAFSIGIYLAILKLVEHSWLGVLWAVAGSLVAWGLLYASNALDRKASEYIEKANEAK